MDQCEKQLLASCHQSQRDIWSCFELLNFGL